MKVCPDMYSTFVVAMCPPLSSLNGIQSRAEYSEPMPYGSIVTLQCEDGLLFSNGNQYWQTQCGLSRSCQPQWSPQPSHCEGMNEEYPINESLVIILTLHYNLFVNMSSVSVEHSTRQI